MIIILMMMMMMMMMMMIFSVKMVEKLSKYKDLEIEVARM